MTDKYRIPGISLPEVEVAGDLDGMELVLVLENGKLKLKEARTVAQTLLTTTSSGNKVLLGPDGEIPLSVSLVSIDAPIGIAPSGTVGASGMLTLGTAMLGVVPNMFLYFPAGAVQTGSAAGFYFVKMTTDTLGRIYLNRYLSQIDERTAVPTTLQPAAGYGSATSYTGIGVSINNAMQMKIPGGTIGKAASLIVHLSQHNNSSGTAKGLGVTFGGLYLAGSGNMTTNIAGRYINRISALGATNSQIIEYNSISSSTSLNGAYTTVDTAQDVIIAVNLSTGLATDWSMLTSLNINLL